MTGWRAWHRVLCLVGRHWVKWDGGLNHCVYCGKPGRRKALP